MDADTKQDRLLTAQDVAQLLGKTPEWVRDHVPFRLKLGHRTLRWFERDVQKWLESFRVTS